MKFSYTSSSIGHISTNKHAYAINLFWGTRFYFILFKINTPTLLLEWIYILIYFLLLERERERERVNINSREILFTWNTSMAQAHLVQKESNPHGNFLIYSTLFSLDKNWTPSLSIQCDFNWWNVIIIRFSISFKEVVITLKKSWYLGECVLMPSVKKKKKKSYCYMEKT